MIRAQIDRLCRVLFRAKCTFSGTWRQYGERVGLDKNWVRSIEIGIMAAYDAVRRIA
jgi:hypothetical protein